MENIELVNIPKETLIELVKMYARNWQTLDGLWFQNVEKIYGLETAAMIDLENWQKMARIEAERIKKVLKLNSGGLEAILTALRFMSWQLASPLFRCIEKSKQRIVFCYARCPIQESRKRAGKPEFRCKAMKTTLLSGLIAVIEPGAKLRCLTCPPDPRIDECWCKWELTVDG